MAGATSPASRRSRRADWLTRAGSLRRTCALDSVQRKVELKVSQPGSDRRRIGLGRRSRSGDDGAAMACDRAETNADDDCRARGRQQRRSARREPCHSASSTNPGAAAATVRWVCSTAPAVGSLLTQPTPGRTPAPTRARRCRERLVRPDRYSCRRRRSRSRSVPGSPGCAASRRPPSRTARKILRARRRGSRRPRRRQPWVPASSGCTSRSSADSRQPHSLRPAESAARDE